MASLEHRFMFIFPGQGAQYPGMGSDLYGEFSAARHIYDRASNVVGFDVAELSFFDPGHELDRTEFTQVALFVQSMACLEVFKDLTNGAVQPYVTAGHSLGEYAALAAAGALTFDDALRVVRARALAMAEYGKGRMVALRLGVQTVRSFVDRFYCGVGGCNLADQTVVGGAEGDLSRLVDFVKSEYRVSAIPLNTEGAFHTYLMIEAAEQFRPALAALPVTPPTCNVLSGYSGKYHSDVPETIKAHLFFQIFNPVRWIVAMQQAFEDGVEVVVEFGGGVGASRHPADKVPNLQRITRAALQRCHSAGVYCGAISAKQLRDTAAFARAYSSICDKPETRNGRTAPYPECTRSYFLYLPVSPVRNAAALDLITSVGELNLTDAVQIIGETTEQNLQELAWLNAPNPEQSQAYLEIVYAGESAAVVHYFGGEIASQLTALSNIHFVNDMSPLPAHVMVN